MPPTEHFEALIIGGGKAGKTLAADIALMGVRTALVERGMIGGTCVNVGCIPSKAMIRSAEIAHLAAHGSEYGIAAHREKIDLAAVRVYKRDVVADAVEANRKKLQHALKDGFILGDAQFVAPRTVEVRPADGGPLRRLSGDKLFINLGARPEMPVMRGIADVKPLTSTTALELDRVPRHLIVMGGGYIGVELAQAFRRFGSEVTIIQHGPHLLPNEDREVSEAVEEIFRSDGIHFVPSANVAAASGCSGEWVELTIERPSGNTTVAGTDLLVAVGRTPLTEGVGLEAAGVEFDGAGFIRVNDRLETTADNTWAMGDSAGSPQQTHVALDDYRIIKANVFGPGGKSTRDRLIPRTVFIDPEVGHVGTTEHAARRAGISCRVFKLPATAIPRAQTTGETRGFMKAIVDARTDQILGFTMFGAHAGEVTAAVQMAMLGGLTATGVRDSVIAHPTMTEGLSYLFASNPERSG